MNALLIKLLNMSAAGSVLILAVVVLRALLKHAPRWIICAMWALVAIRLVCPVSIASPVSAFRATPAIVSESGEVELFRLVGVGVKPMLAVDTVQIERPQMNAETIREISGTPYAVTQRSHDTYLPPLVQAYLLGLTAMLLYAMVSTLLLRRKVSASLRQRGNIRVCDEVASPFILGIARPVIYLPSSLSGEEKRFVLAHERAHLRRLDHIWKPLGFLILSVHWFNPFCWLAYVLLCRDIELACDEKVIRELGRDERAAYSQTLLNCSAHRVLAACPVAFGETDVKARIKAVLNYKKPAFWIVLAAVLGCLVLVVCFATNPMQEQDLSFLNYKNSIPLIGQNDTAPYASLSPADSDSVQPGVADAKALAQFLESAKWTKRRAPSSSPEPRGYLEFMIEDDYRIIVYQSERLAAVRFGSEIRYYRTGAGDYEAALATFIPAPSTEPDRVPEQSPAPPIPAGIAGANPVFSSGLAADGVVYGSNLLYLSGDDVRSLSLNGDRQNTKLITLRALHMKLPDLSEVLYESYVGNFYLDGNRLVMNFISLAEPVSRFISCDLIDGSVQLLCTTAETYIWTLLDERLYYLEEVSGLENADAQILRVLDLQTGEDRIISRQVSAFGSAGEKIRYTSYSEESYQVFSFDPNSGASALLGSIPASLGKNCVFAFTPDYITMGRFGPDVWNYSYSSVKARKLIVFNAANGETTEYSLGSELQELVVCGNYAFVQAYNLTEDSRNPDKAAGLYRINLSNGEMDWNSKPFLGGLYTCTDEVGLFWVYSDSFFSFGTLYCYDTRSGEVMQIGTLR